MLLLLPMLNIIRHSPMSMLLPAAADTMLLLLLLLLLHIIRYCIRAPEQPTCSNDLPAVSVRFAPAAPFPNAPRACPSSRAISLARS
jgi:hypothetical protein